MSLELSPFIKTLLSLIGISTIAAASRTIMSEDRRTIRAFLRGLLLATFVGGIVGALIHDYTFSDETKGGIVGVCAFVADDILQLLINLSLHLRNHPRDIVKFFLRK